MGCSSCGGPKYGGGRSNNRVRPAATTALPVTPKPPKRKVKPVFRNGRFVFDTTVEEKPDEG